MSRIYIIGNGFDKAHGISSGYSDFKNYCMNNIPDMYEKLNYYYGNRVDDLWSNFETNMPNISKNAIFEMARNNHRDWNQNMNGYYAFINEICNEMDYMDLIKQDFTEWIQSIELNNVDRLYDLPIENTWYLSFNYTLTLERIYHILPQQICHIHGCVQGQFPQLVLGHNIQDAEIDAHFTSENAFMQEACGEVANLVKGWRKDTQTIIEQNEDFFDVLADVTDVFVLGHSMSDVDMPYFQKVKQSVNDNVVWYMSFFDENDRNRKEQVAEQLQLERYEFIQLDDLELDRE